MVDAPRGSYPGSSDALPEWEDADVQTVYQMLCDDALNCPPNPEEHWEGWISRNIVRAMRARTGAVAQISEDTPESVAKELKYFDDHAERFAGTHRGIAAAAQEAVGCGGIYIASKVKHANRWRFLRDALGEPIISTWIDEAGEGETSDHDDLWRRCITEASNCRLLIVYREADEVLKGAWVELGCALTKGVPVYAVGLESYTIAKYRGITHFATMKEAISASRALLRSPQVTCRSARAAHNPFRKGHKVQANHVELKGNRVTAIPTDGRPLTDISTPQYSCPCGIGEKPCPDPDGKPLCARTPIMQADIAQIISEGWRNGKTASEVADEILRELER